jgi:hypothetical protein
VNSQTVLIRSHHSQSSTLYHHYFSRISIQSKSSRSYATHKEKANEQTTSDTEGSSLLFVPQYISIPNLEM